MIAGWLTRLSTPPSDSAQANSSVRSMKRRAAGRPPFNQMLTMPPKPCICFFASSCCGCEASPGYTTFSIAGCACSHSASCIALSQCAFMRRCSVFRPRRARKLSNGPCTPPTAFCRKVICSASSVSSPTTSMPPTMSEWPLRYLVAECMTMCAPRSSGRCSIGDENVLSTASRMPRLRANSARRAISTIFSSGLVGVSHQINFVFGVTAASSAAMSLRSTKLKSSPAERRRTRSNNRYVPP